MLTATRPLLWPLRVLPRPFGLLRLALSQMTRLYPPEGWDFTFLEDSADAMAFNATRCYYLDTLSVLGALELTAAFCKSDKIMAEQFPRSIRFLREGTMAGGAAACDVRYCRVGRG